MTGQLFTGTSGFAFKEWKGVFYPEGVTDKKMLAYYSSVLKSVEINYTFRKMPEEKTLLGWKEQASDEFAFTLKAPQRITHFKRLVDVSEQVDEFVRRARCLGDRLGVILFQLPPNFVFDRETLASFLTGLPPVCRYAMEFRHDSWKSEEARALLREHGVAECGADTDEKPCDQIPVTAKHAYLRLRKEDYTDDEITAWAKKVIEVLDSGTDVYCYFKHEDGAAGPRFALSLADAVR